MSSLCRCHCCLDGVFFICCRTHAGALVDCVHLRISIGTSLGYMGNLDFCSPACEPGSPLVRLGHSMRSREIPKVGGSETEIINLEYKGKSKPKSTTGKTKQLAFASGLEVASSAFSIHSLLSPACMRDSLENWETFGISWLSFN